MAQDTSKRISKREQAVEAILTEDAEWQQFNKEMDMREQTITKEEFEKYYYKAIYSLRLLEANDAATEGLRLFRYFFYHEKGWWPK